MKLCSVAMIAGVAAQSVPARQAQEEQAQKSEVTATSNYTQQTTGESSVDDLLSLRLWDPVPTPTTATGRTLVDHSGGAPHRASYSQCTPHVPGEPRAECMSSQKPDSERTLTTAMGRTHVTHNGAAPNRARHAQCAPHVPGEPLAECMSSQKPNFERAPATMKAMEKTFVIHVNRRAEQITTTGPAIASLTTTPRPSLTTSSSTSTTFYRQTAIGEECSAGHAKRCRFLPNAPVWPAGGRECYCIQDKYAQPAAERPDFNQQQKEAHGVAVKHIPRPSQMPLNPDGTLKLYPDQAWWMAIDPDNDGKPDDHLDNL